ITRAAASRFAGSSSFLAGAVDSSLDDPISRSTFESGRRRLLVARAPAFAFATAMEPNASSEHSELAWSESERRRIPARGDGQSRQRIMTRSAARVGPCSLLQVLIQKRYCPRPRVSDGVPVHAQVLEV